MNTKNRIFALLIAILALGSVLHATITFRPAGPAPGQTVTFTLNPTHPDMVRDNQITWVWSDGTQLIVPTTQLTAAHVYASAGAYEVSARYYYRSSTGAPTYFAETIGVRVAAAGKTIAFSPGNPNSCAPVTFQARGFLSAQLRWEFGDGTVLTGGGAAATHAYTAPGSFKVKVFDYDGRDPVPAAKVVAVADKRSIKILTASPKAGEPVDFKASGFVSSCIRWEFGDGGSTSNGTATAGHVYAAAGTFQVKAVDQCGDSHCTAMVNVKVGSQKPKTVAFQPEKPNSCEPVTFQASGFVSTKLRTPLPGHST
jgi:PKD repeat protein